jgi:transcription factor E
MMATSKSQKSKTRSKSTPKAKSSAKSKTKVKIKKVISKSVNIIKSKLSRFLKSKPKSNQKAKSKKSSYSAARAVSSKVLRSKLKSVSKPKAASRAKMPVKAKVLSAKLKTNSKAALKAKSSVKVKIEPKVALKGAKSKTVDSKVKGAKSEAPVKEVPKINKAEITGKITSILADARIRQMLIEMGGENALAIIRNFYGNYSDEDIAKNLKLKISDVRATLNRLHNEGLVNYSREKDNETGWYSYSWSLNLGRMEKWAGIHLSKMIRADDDGDYYICADCGVTSITNLESAVLKDFKCEICNCPLDYLEEKKKTELLEKRK